MNWLKDLLWRWLLGKKYSHVKQLKECFVGGEKCVQLIAENGIHKIPVVVEVTCLPLITEQDILTSAQSAVLLGAVGVQIRLVGSEVRYRWVYPESKEVGIIDFGEVLNQCAEDTTHYDTTDEGEW